MRRIRNERNSTRNLPGYGLVGPGEVVEVRDGDVEALLGQPRNWSEVPDAEPAAPEANDDDDTTAEV